MIFHKNFSNHNGAFTAQRKSAQRCATLLFSRVQCFREFLSAFVCLKYRAGAFTAVNFPVKMRCYTVEEEPERIFDAAGKLVDIRQGDLAVKVPYFFLGHNIS
jgi:hypothetical protein